MSKVYILHLINSLWRNKQSNKNGVFIMASNFTFLKEDFPDLENMGVLAEGYLYSDPNGSMYKMGTLAETLVNHMFDLENIKPSPQDTTQDSRIKTLYSLKKIPKTINDMLHLIRKSRNEAVHAGYDCLEQSKTLLQMTHTITVWFIQIYGNLEFEPNKFVMPEDKRSQPNYDKLLEENQKIYAELEKIQATLSARKHKRIDATQRRKNADRANRNLRLSERETRYLIDDQLRKVGWEADSINLRYSKGVRPENGRNIAIAEWPTDPMVCKWGYVNYAFFAGLKLVGVVEAEMSNKNIALSLDNQCREYSMGIKDEHMRYVINTWGEYKVPFLFATNGRLYEEQSETNSGVWFCDVRDTANAPKVLQDWLDPKELVDMLEKDIATTNQRQKSSPRVRLKSWW